MSFNQLFSLFGFHPLSELPNMNHHRTSGHGHHGHGYDSEFEVQEVPNPTSGKRGRPTSQVWGYLTDEPEPQKHNNAICKHCQTRVLYHKKSDAAKQHLLYKCPPFRAMMMQMAEEQRPNWFTDEPVPKKRPGRPPGSTKNVESSAPMLAPVSRVSSAFRSQRSITVEMADELASRVLAVACTAFATKKNVSVSVLDVAGEVLVQKRMDSCPPAFLALAQAKANTCIQLGMSSREYGGKYLSTTATPDTYIRLVNQLVAMKDRSVAAFPGGVLICKKQHNVAAMPGVLPPPPLPVVVLGALGVSGAAGDEDEYCAIAAIEQCSFQDRVSSEPATHSCSTLLRGLDDSDDDDERNDHKTEHV
jgi:uncharacterized protein GlcG (DUF336 family)